jgi:hypothetical protein
MRMEMVKVRLPGRIRISKLCLYSIVEPHTCCCGHTSRCTCALKKDHLDTVPEDTPQPILPAVLPTVLPKEPHHNRLSSLNSHESKLTVFQNGHHKPVHKINDSHNMCGAPYKIPSRSHTVHGHREIAQRSSDSLPLTKAALMSHETPQHHESVTSAPQPVRLVKSEHGSPEIKPVSPPLEQKGQMVIPPLDPNAYSYSPFGTASPLIQQPNQAETRFPDPFPENYFVTYEMANEWEPPMHSAGLSESGPEVDWSQYPLTNDSGNNYNGNDNGNANDVAPSQPPSYASFDHFSHLSHPGLTSSSGEISEVEDYVPVNNSDKMRAHSQDALDDFSSIGGDDSRGMESYRLSSASSYIGMPQANMLANANMEGLDIDDYLKQAEAQTRKMALQSQRLQQQQQQQQQRPADLDFPSPSKAVVGEHPFTIQEAQTYAHMNDNALAGAQAKPQAPVTNYVEDPMWSYPPPDTPSSMIDADEQDDGWVR